MDKDPNSEGQKLLNDIHSNNRGLELGLLNIWAYHCKRCNYVWLPKDFDFDRNEPHKENGRWGIYGQDLFFREPPKSCARCKSKYWKDSQMQRKSKSAHVDDDEDKFIFEPTSMTRFNALIRQGEYLKAALLRPEYAEMMSKVTGNYLNKLDREKRKAEKLAANPAKATPSDH